MHKKYNTAEEMLNQISPLTKGYIANVIIDRVVEAKDLFIDELNERCDEDTTKPNQIRNFDAYVSSGFCEKIAVSNQPFKIIKSKTSSFGNIAVLLDMNNIYFLIKLSKKGTSLPAQAKYKKKLAAGNRFLDQLFFGEQQCIMEDAPYFVIVNFVVDHNCDLTEICAIIPDENYKNIHCCEDWLAYKNYNLLEIMKDVPQKSTEPKFKKSKESFNSRNGENQ